MSAIEDAKQKTGISDYLAAEGTLLAWIRTGLALMGFGFVVARFGLFLQQIQVVENRSFGGSFGLSLWFGTALILSGVIVSVAAGLQHLRLVRKLDRGEVTRPHSALMAVLMALLLACIGIGMTIYLISVRGNQTGTKTMQEGSMTIMTDSGIVDIRSRHSVDETVNRLRDLLESKAITLFALVDHSEEAEKVAMTMRPTKLLIFGSPKAGTPVMQAAPTSAIDLPLKILVWENSNGEVLVSYNSPEYLEERHGIPHELVANLAAVKVLAKKAAE